MKNIVFYLVLLSIPFFSSVAALLNKKHPNIKFHWGINEDIKPIFEKKYRQEAYKNDIETVGTTYDMIICLTGTNTAISAALGIPMLVLLPFNFPKLVPFMGLFGLLAELPLVGIWLKKAALKIVAKKMKLIALPNMKAGRMIVPELVGFLTPQQVADEAEKLLVNISEREKINSELPIFMGHGGAAKRIAEKFQEIFS